MHTISQLKSSVASILSGIDLNNVDDLYGAFESADRTLIQQAAIPEASDIQNITLYAGVIDYPCDQKIFGTAINDIRPQGISRFPGDFVFKMFADDFDRNKLWGTKYGTMATFQYYKGDPIIRIVSRYAQQSIVIDPMSSTSGWDTIGTAFNLRQDTTDFYQSPASLRFSLNTGIGTLLKTLQSPLSMESYQGVGVAFLAIQIPEGATPEQLSQITLYLGSDDSNFDFVQASTGFLGNWVDNNWLLVAFDFANATTNGSPDWTSIQYVQIDFNWGGSTLNNMRTGYLFISLPTPAQILFQTPAIFKSTDGVVSSTIESVTDTVILNDAAYNIYLYECAEEVLRRTGGALADSRMADIHSKLFGARARNGAVINPGLYDIYRGDNPSQELRQAGNWYTGENYNTRPYT